MHDPPTPFPATAPPVADPPPAPLSAAGADAESVHCPLCEYDLRGLVESRCPECGYCFTWAELRDPSRRTHPYLFEHHPERNAGSFLDTLLGGLAPTRFWSTLYPTQPSRPLRLLIYWVSCALPLLAVAVVLTSQNFLGLRNAMPWRVWGRAGLVPTALRLAAYDIRGGATVFVAVMCLAWPWLTLAALLVFQVSLRRARLRWIHVLRCTLYSGDLVFWYALPLALVALFAWVGGVWPPQSPLGDAWAVVPVALFLVLAYRLSTAYRLYLRFDHPLATVVASQVMVGLIFWKAWFLFQGM